MYDDEYMLKLSKQALLGRIVNLCILAKVVNDADCKHVKFACHLSDPGPHIERQELLCVSQEIQERVVLVFLEH